MAMRPTPPETIMNLQETKRQLGELVNRVSHGETRVVVERDGLRAAVMISPEEYDRLVSADQAQNEEPSEFAKAAAEFSRAFDDVSDEELEGELARIRKEYREITDKERPGR